MSSSVILESLFSYIDNNQMEYIENLREAISIPSVSGNADHFEDVLKMIEWTCKRLKSLGCEVHVKDVELEHKGSPIPGVILARLGNDSKKKTVCIYGHLDVQPALMEDGWDSPPFQLTERNGNLYGRGATDDKGPVLCWINALEAFQAIGEVPVNIKFVLESMEESGSAGLEELLVAERNFFDDVDYVCVSDNMWLGTKRPTLTYGLRGISYYHLEVEGAATDLHSGMFGGTVQEAMADLIYLLNSLTDKNGKIEISNFYDNVAPLMPYETELYDNILFDVDEFRTFVGCNKLLHDEDKVKLLMHRWRYPSLSIHGIEGAFGEPGSKTVIPRKVIGKFSIRFVPNHTSKEVEELVVSFLEQKWKERNSSNNMKITVTGFGEPWTEDPFHPNYLAGARATKSVYGVEPDLVREGGSIPVLLTLQKVSKKNVLLLPVGQSDDGAHSQNEKLSIRNYIQGTKLLGAYLYEVSQIQ